MTKNMTKNNRTKNNRQKKLRGGFLGVDTSGWTSGLSDKWTGLTSGLSDKWSGWTSGWGDKSKYNTTYIPPPSSSSPPPSSPSSPPSDIPYGPSNVGGKKRKRSVKRGGSYSPSMSQTNLASSASPVFDIKTVRAQTWVGGKTRRRKNNKR